MTTILNNGHAQGNFAADMPAVKIQFFKVEKKMYIYINKQVHSNTFQFLSSIGMGGGGGIINVYCIMKFDPQGFFKIKINNGKGRGWVFG